MQEKFTLLQVMAAWLPRQSLHPLIRIILTRLLLLPRKKALAWWLLVLKHLLLWALQTLFVRSVLHALALIRMQRRWRAQRRLPRALWSEQTFQLLHGSLSQTRRLVRRMFATSVHLLLLRQTVLLQVRVLLLQLSLSRPSKVFASVSPVTLAMREQPLLSRSSLRGQSVRYLR